LFLLRNEVTNDLISLYDETVNLMSVTLYMYMYGYDNTFCARRQLRAVFLFYIF